MKFLSFALLAVVLFPSVTHAAWWNFFSWKKTSTSTTALATTSKDAIIEELNRRIEDLERQLNNERANRDSLILIAKDQLKPAAKEIVQSAPVTPAANTSGISEKAVSTKVIPAMVAITTATTTGTGTIITSQGYILTEAHTVWIKDPSNNKITGAANQVSITLSNGSKKTAKLVGIDEAHDIAVLKISDGGTYPYIKINYGANTYVGGKAYVFGRTGDFVSGTVTQKKTASVELNTDKRPNDNGGAVVDADGGLVGIPNASSCKVLEEMKNCLKYTVVVNDIRSVLPKLLEGMQLYEEKAVSTNEESLVRGQLEGVYRNTKTNSILDYAVVVASGKNSFDYFNSKLGEDQEGKITKIYLNKLKSTAESMYAAADFLKTQSYALNIFFINESSAISTLGEYQQKIIKQIQASNALKLKEYEAKVTLWSAKKNEYDGYITNPSAINHDYLMEQGVYIESATTYFDKERKAILDTFSGENVAIF